MILGINHFHIIAIFSQIVRISKSENIVINEETHEIKLECELSSNNSLLWLKDGKELSYNSSYMYFHLKQYESRIGSELIIFDLESDRDQGIYTCNDERYEVSFFNSIVKVTQKTFNEQSHQNIFIKFWTFLKEGWTSFRDFIIKIINIYRDLGLQVKIILWTSIVLIIILGAIIAIISQTYKRANLNYAKVKYMLKFDIDNEDKYDDRNEKQDSERDLDIDIVDYSFVSLLNK